MSDEREYGRSPIEAALEIQEQLDAAQDLMMSHIEVSAMRWVKPDEQRQRAFQRWLIGIAHWQWWGGIVLAAELN
jgi:hypothetical protein